MRKINRQYRYTEGGEVKEGDKVRFEYVISSYPLRARGCVGRVVMHEGVLSIAFRYADYEAHTRRKAVIALANVATITKLR